MLDYSAAFDSVPQRQQVIFAAAVSLPTTTLNRDGAAEDS